MMKSLPQLVVKWVTYQRGDLLIKNGRGQPRLTALVLSVTLLVTITTARADDATSSTNKLAKTDAVMLAPEIATENDDATNTDQLSSKVTDTIAPLMSVKLKLGWSNYHGPNLPGQPDSATSGQVQMAIPFSVFEQPNLLRISMPFQLDGRGDDGVQRITVFDLLAFSQDWGRWGIGPVMSVDATGHADDRFVLGPAAGMTWHVNSKLKLGFLSQNVFWSDTARSYLQPIIAYQLGNGWALSSGDLQFTYDWNRERWINVPVGFQISKVWKIWREPISFGLSQQYNLLNNAGSKGYSISFSVTFLFPTLGHYK